MVSTWRLAGSSSATRTIGTLLLPRPSQECVNDGQQRCRLHRTAEKLCCSKFQSSLAFVAHVFHAGSAEQEKGNCPDSGIRFDLPQKVQSGIRVHVQVRD